MSGPGGNTNGLRTEAHVCDECADRILVLEHQLEERDDRLRAIASISARR